MKCTIAGCDRNAAPDNYFARLLQRLGMRSEVYVPFGAAFESVCKEHADEQAYNTAVRAGLVIRDQKPVGTTRAEEVHYPASASARRQRLAEIEADMDAPVRKAPAKSYQSRREYQPSKKDQAKEAESVTERARLYWYLRQKGYSDPSKIFNV